MRNIQKEHFPHPRRLGGATVLRLVAVSPRVTEAALWETITDIRAIAGEAQTQALS